MTASAHAPEPRSARLFTALCVAGVSVVSAAVLVGVMLLRRQAGELSSQAGQRAEFRTTIDRIQSLTGVLTWLGVVAVALLMFLLVQALRDPRLGIRKG